MEFNNYPQMISTMETNDSVFKLFGVVAIFVWLGVSAFNWCSDPVGEKLNERIAQLEEELDNVNKTLDSVEEERDFLRDRLKSASKHIQALTRAVDETWNSSDEDSIASTRKRLRVE